MSEAASSSHMEFPRVWWTLSEATGSVIRTGGVLHGSTQTT